MDVLMGMEFLIYLDDQERNGEWVGCSCVAVGLCLDGGEYEWGCERAMHRAVKLRLCRSYELEAMYRGCVLMWLCDDGCVLVWLCSGAAVF
jgi:hypothetical protein